MKKILAITVVLATTFAANAATLTWNLMNIKEVGSTTANATGYTAYLFISQQSSDFGAKTASIETITSLIKSKGDLSEYIASTKTVNNGTASGATGYNGTAFTAGDSLTGFAVVFDASDYSNAKNYFVTAEKSASWTSATGQKPLAFGNMANATWTAVPEPSTAVLALAGLALLLKRRKA